MRGLKMKHFVWISFDLGVKGDYEGMYAWLDSKDAKECGDSTVHEPRAVWNAVYVAPFSQVSAHRSNIADLH